VSPIVGGQALKGPAAKMMAELGVEPSALAVAAHYRDLASTVVIDNADADSADAISDLGVTPRVTNTIMQSNADKARLAGEIIQFLDGADG
jgi:LPPG:FO 2-phospho-L-lactate transferase